ncbi:MAG: hypothetical protein G01um101419_488 [Parcubacteria group bacterium Gr01-1014_19]|nr:MAG: hypothetical protein G01um101419_488 [Parcubacteria group bacterium Gr01-1014_19]
MDPKAIAKTISEASRKELTLLYYLPDELERAINEKRAVILEEEGRLIGGCFWRKVGDWLELDTLYILPEFRGRGYVRKLFSRAKDYLQINPDFRKAFLFTQVPAIRKIVAEYDFQPKRFSRLPWSVWLKIFKHRLHPLRILSYFKYFRELRRLGTWQLFTFERE